MWHLPLLEGRPLRRRSEQVSCFVMVRRRARACLDYPCAPICVCRAGTTAVALKVPPTSIPLREAETAVRSPGRVLDYRDRIEYWARSRLASFANASPAISALKCAVC